MADEHAIAKPEDAAKPEDVAKPDDELPYHLIVIGERRTRLMTSRSPDEIAKWVQEYRDNDEITDVHLFRGHKLEVSVVHETSLVFHQDEKEVGRGKVISEAESIDNV